VPNWCSTQIRITGPSSKINALVASTQSESRVLDFDKIRPTPAPLLAAKTEEERDENLKAYGHADWYDWRNANWGTKWNSDGEYAVQEPDSLYIEFLTAWGPPLEILDQVAEDNKELKIVASFEESGMDFRGCAVWRDGVRESEAISHHPLM